MRGGEQEPAAATGHDESWLLADRQVAAHHRSRHQVVFAGQVAAIARPALSSICCEQPDVVATAGAGRETMAEDREFLAVREPGRCNEVTGAVGDPGYAARLNVDNPDLAAPADVPVTPTLCAERDPSSVG